MSKDSKKKAAPKKKDEPKKVQPIPAAFAEKIYAAQGSVKFMEAKVEQAKIELKTARDILESRQAALGKLLDDAESGQGNLFEK